MPTAVSPENLYFELGRLIAEAPLDLASSSASEEKTKWLARAAALMDTTNDLTLNTDFRIALRNIHSFHYGISAAQELMLALHTALAKMELAAPVSARGNFIAAGSTYDAFAAVGKALGEAKADVLLIDPYSDETVLKDYAVLAAEKVRVRILADQAYKKPTLAPAAKFWSQQYGDKRPLEVRYHCAKNFARSAHRR